MKTADAIESPSRKSARRAARPSIFQRNSVRHAAWVGVVTVAVALGSILLLFPIAFMITTSLKTSGGAFLLPIKWIPGPRFPPRWRNFGDSLAIMQWQVSYGNTLKVTINNTVADVVSASIVAHGFARLRARGKNFFFMLMLSTMMIPSMTRLVPEYLIFSKLGMVDTLLPLVIPPWFGSAFSIFLLRQFFMTIPKEMDEAAKIDGAGHVRVFISVLLPQIKPALAVVAIGSFMFNWHDFLRPLIYLDSAQNRTAAVALSFFQAPFGGTPYNLLMAATLINVLPTVALFFVAQRFFIQGIVISGVKG